MAKRPRHQDKDIEQALAELEAQGWRITKGKGYYRIYCPCGVGTHQRSVALTPSSRNYLKNLRGWVSRKQAEHNTL